MAAGTSGKARRGPRAARVRLAAVAGVWVLLGGCAIQAGPLDDAASRQSGSRSCARIARTAPAAPSQASVQAPRTSGPSGISGTSAVPLVEGFSRDAVDIAEVIGALAPLRELARLESHVGDAADMVAELRLLRVRQRITETILRAMLDVSSVLAEIDCENERGDQLRDHLQKLEDRRTRRLGLGSILVGALTAIVSGGLSLAGTHGAGGDVAAIVGGTLEASVGASVLFGGVSGELRTERNLMREVWEGPAESGLFPRSVWRFLGRPVDGEADAPTLRDVLIAQWRAGERLGPAQSQSEHDRIGLLFGAGGAYTIEDLNARDAMLDLLESSVASMNQDLQQLLDELAQRTGAGQSTPAP